jgi:hypothetical protein
MIFRHILFADPCRNYLATIAFWRDEAVRLAESFRIVFRLQVYSFWHTVIKAEPNLV